MPEIETVRVLSVQNKMGIHARPAAMIVRISNKYSDTDVKVEKDGEEVNGKSIMNIMAACIKCGTEITVECDGTDEQAMLDEAIALIESGFGE